MAKEDSGGETDYTDLYTPFLRQGQQPQQPPEYQPPEQAPQPAPPPVYTPPARPATPPNTVVDVGGNVVAAKPMPEKVTAPTSTNTNTSSPKGADPNYTLDADTARIKWIFSQQGKQATQVDVDYWKGALSRANGDWNYIEGRMRAPNTGGTAPGSWDALHGVPVAGGGGGGGQAPTAYAPVSSGGGGSFNGNFSSGGMNPMAQDLYDRLLRRADQSLKVDPNDPIIRAQTDAYGAQQTKAERDYEASLAERAGPNANIGMERRAGAETIGQNVGGFQAQLMGRELDARRQEIQQALTGAAGLLTTEQQMGLQKELADLDRAQRALEFQANLGERQYEFGAGLTQQESEFARNLGQRGYEFDINDQFRNSPLGS